MVAKNPELTISVKILCVWSNITIFISKYNKLVIKL